MPLLFILYGNKVLKQKKYLFSDGKELETGEQCEL
jgi:hypothetical protein